MGDLICAQGLLVRFSFIFMGTKLGINLRFTSLHENIMRYAFYKFQVANS